MRSAGVNQLLSVADGIVGDLTDGAKKIPVANLITHAIVGGLAAEATGGKFAAGAAAGLASAVAAQSGLFDGLSAKDIAKISQLAGASAALLAGGNGRDVNQGAATAQSAALNNYLTHAEINAYVALLKARNSCAGGRGGANLACSATINAQLDALNELSKANNAALIASCNDGVSADCRARIQDLVQFANIANLTGYVLYSSAEERAVYESSERAAVFNYDTILAAHYSKVLNGTLTPQEAQAATEKESANKKGLVKAATATLAFGGGVLTCISGVGTPVCVVGGLSNSALGIRDAVSSYNLIQNGKDLDVFVEALAKVVPREQAAIYADYAAKGLIALTLVDGVYGIAKTSTATQLTDTAFNAVANDVKFLNSRTAAGDKIYHGSASTALGSDTVTINNFNKAIDSGNGHNVIVHGDLSYDELGGIPVINGRPTNPAQIAEAVRGNPNYVEGTQVCFASCWSASSGTAQELANSLRAPVYAPTRPVAWDAKTSKWVFDTDVKPIQELTNLGIKPGWQIFYPK